MNQQETLIDALQKQNNALQALLGNDQQKTIGGASTFTPLHGVGGIWTGAGIDPEILTAHVRPKSLASELPIIPTVYTSPLYGILTGYTDVNGAQPTKACDDAPSGFVKGGSLTAKFGMLRMDSQEIDRNDVMLRLHRGDFTDLMLRGRVLGMTNLNPSQITDTTEILNIVSASEMVTVAVNVERALARQLWQGSAALGQFPGIDSQVATGQIDAETGTPMPSVDSDVKNFGYDALDGNGRDIVEYLSSMEFYLRYNAETMGLDPVTWVIVMRPEMWFELSAVWPCRYLTNRCGTAAGSNPMVINDNVNVAMRDDMRNNKFIDINGNRYKVITDVGIFEHTNINNGNLGLGQYASTIYFLPLTVTGNFPVLYREHLDYRAAAPDDGFTMGNLPVWDTDNGLFSWALSYEKWCYKFHLVTKQRIILRTPHLAGRLDNVRYSPLQHLRESFPDSPYHANGGVSTRSNDPGYQAVWL